MKNNNNNTLKYIVVGLIAAGVTVVGGTSTPLQAKSRRINPITNCVQTQSSLTLYPTEDGSWLSAVGRRGEGAKLVCDIPSDGYLRHHNIKAFNVHATNNGLPSSQQPYELRYRVCITDFRDNWSTVCGRWTDAPRGEDRKAKVRDLHILRDEGRKAWFPALAVEGLSEVTSITGYYMRD